MIRLIAILLVLFSAPVFAASNCISSGDVTKTTYFVAVDSVDKTTRETGLSSFTVYRSRNGGSAAAFTTPTVSETDATNMPGVYELLLDEDMTISGDGVEHMALHITHAGMEPVTKEICIAPGIKEAAAAQGIHTTTIAVLTDQDTFTLTAGSSDDDTYNGWAAFVRDASTATQVALGVVQDYTGATKTVQLCGDPGVFTMAANDNVILMPAKFDCGEGNATLAKLDDTLEDDSGVFRFTTNALEQAPSGSGGAGDGSGLTSIPWNPAWDAEVQSEVTDALLAYDPPTKTEMDAGFGGLNDLDSTEVQAAAAAALAAYDPPTRAELTSDIGSVTSALGTLQSAVNVIDGIVDQLLVGVNVEKINTHDVCGTGDPGTPWAGCP